MAQRRAALSNATKPTKDAKYERAPDGRQAAISWRFGLADRGGPYAWTAIRPEQLAELIDVLHETDKHHWDAASGDGMGKIKRIPTSHLSPEARKRLEHIQRDDEDELYEIHLGNKPRVWGTRGEQTSVFHVLWWDPQHKVCPAPLRRT